MDFIFWICVRLMVIISHALGITYQLLNVLLFVILHPALTLWLWYRYRHYKRRFTEVSASRDQPLSPP
jgi:Flp pilus assembly protein TadB